MKSIRSPITGATLVLNAGDWTGLYGGPDSVEPIPPKNINPPSFVTPIPSTVGSITRVQKGDWAPLASTIRIQIGYGTSLSNFVAVVEADNLTIPTTMAGQRLSAVVHAKHDNITSSAIFLDSGVTIAGTNLDWPSDIPSTSWNVEEIRDEAPAGRRRLTVVSSVTIPTGFILKAVSSNTNGLLPTTSSPTITPGTDFIFGNTLTTGSTCYNNLAWVRTSDGAVKIAHPTSQQKSFQIQGLVIIPPPIGTGDYTPDVVVSSIANVRSQITAWINNWSGTIPSGKDINDNRVIGVNASTSGVFDLTGLVNNQATINSRQIIVRHVGTFSNYDCSVRHTGPVRFLNSRGIICALMRIVGTENFNTDIDNATICGVKRCLIDGVGSSFPPTGEFPIDYALRIRNSTDYIVHDCIIRFADQTTLLLWDQLKPGICRGIVFDWVQRDDVKAFGATRGLIFDRNWGTRRKFISNPADHRDFYQSQGAETTNSTFSNNILANGCGNGSMWGGIAVSPVGQQYFFYKHEGVPQLGQLLDGTVWEQNMAFSTNGSIKPDLPPALRSYTGASVRDNALITLFKPQDNGMFVQGLTNVCSRNLICAGINQTTAVNMGAGDGGVHIPSGNFNDRSTDLDDTRDYSPLANYFNIGIPFQDAAGNSKNLLNTPALREMEPKAGSRMHWTWGGTKVGPTVRLREIYDTTYRYAQEKALGFALLPGDVGWPMKTWQDVYNPDNYVKTRISNTTGYDTNGDFVDAVAPTISSSSPSDNATNVSKSNPITITFSKPIKFDTGLITIRRRSGSTWSDVETFDVETEQGTTAGKVYITNSTLTIYPTTALAASTEHAIRIGATALENLCGTRFAGIANDTTLSFTTGA